MSTASKTFEELEVTAAIALDHGLTAEEYERILEILGRVPTYPELGIFSVMWSEHCSYKNSIAQLKTLPRSGGRLLVEAGEENAGLVDIGGGLAVAFKIESHNHPSAVEPYQGAATGVGGIMRDIFTMGARPIAALNSLRFGDVNRERTQYLIKGVVKGIGDYGNSFGVPTVAGEVYFDPCYNENPLVNAMAVGVVHIDKIAKAIATGDGNLVLIVGSSTGRDGIHGATFASEEINEESESRRPAVQVGDPFTEKMLLEATLEAIGANLVVGIQDMGAAGLTCSTAEMSAKGNSGMEIELSEVPLREQGMSPYEIMLSESQERMLLVVKPENEKAVSRIFEKWDLQCKCIGRVTDTGEVRVKHRGDIIATVPAKSLVLGGGAPVYQRESVRPAYLDHVTQVAIDKIPPPDDYSAALMQMLGSPNICSRMWVTRQYDSMVRGNTLSGVFLDAAVVRIKGNSKALALKTDCNPRYVYLNPYRGAQIAVAESARNVVCVGGKPIAITNCLNFGNPYKPEVFWQFKEAVRGIGDACRAFETPVTGGNVSFFNESPDGTVYPTPVIGMLGEIIDAKRAMTGNFKDPADIIILLGSTSGNLGGSEYLSTIHGLVAGDCPELQLSAEKATQSFCLELINRGLIKSAHDVSDGGLAVSLAESCFSDNRTIAKTGISVRIPVKMEPHKYLFCEDQSRIIVTAAGKQVEEVVKLSQRFGVETVTLGEVTNDGIFNVEGVLRIDISELRHVYDVSLGRRLGGS